MKFFKQDVSVNLKLVEAKDVLTVAPIMDYMRDFIEDLQPILDGEMKQRNMYARAYNTLLSAGFLPSDCNGTPFEKMTAETQREDC